MKKLIELCLPPVLTVTLIWLLLSSNMNIAFAPSSWNVFGVILIILTIVLMVFTKINSNK